MVEIETLEEGASATTLTSEEIEVEGAPLSEDASPVLTASAERLLDAEAIEMAAASIDRPTARAHLEALSKKLRRDASALLKVEESRSKADMEEKEEREAGSPTNPASAAAAPAPTKRATPAKRATPPPVVPSTGKFTTVDRFSFDAGGYNSERVSLFVPLPGVGGIPRERVTSVFTPTSFDLIVHGLNGKDYRLFKDNLEKDIDPSTSKHVVKADKVILRLGKVKGEYGSFDHWSQLTAKRTKKKAPGGKSEKDDPSASIMNLMKDMYDDGDDNMKRMIGETMMKQRNGQLDKEKPDLGMGGMGLGDDM